MFSTKKFLNDLQTQNLKLSRLNSYQIVKGTNDRIIVIRNGKAVWSVAWIEYYLRLNLSF